MDDTELKQNYLRENIIDKEYNPEEFGAYLINIKGEDGGDINNWTLDELKAMVEKFCNTHQKMPSQSEIVNQQTNKETNKETNEETNEKTNQGPAKTPEDIEQEPQKSDEQEVNQKKPDEEEENPKNQEEQKEVNAENNEKNDQVGKLDQEKESFNFNEVIKCKPTENTEMAKCTELKITLSFPEKIEGGIFSKSYVTYLISTSPFEYKVRKRYSDFEWLRAILSTIYLGSVIPKLPRKNYGDRFNEAFISKRMRSLEKFLQGLAVDPLIRSSKIFFDFLTMENEEQWNLRKQALNKLKPSSKLETFKSTTGELNLKITNESEIYLQNIKDNCEINDALLKKIMAAYKMLIANMEIVSKNMNDLSQLWNELYDNSSKFFENTKVTDTYNILTKSMKDWGDSIKRQAELINIEVREYFKYIRGEFKVMKELASKAEYYKNSFYRADEKLVLKKEDLFRRQDIMRWDLDQKEMGNKLKLLQDKEYAFNKMLPKETQQVVSTKKYYGYFLNRVIQEYERLKDLNGERHRTKVISFSKKNSDIITDLHISMADLISYFSDGKKH